MPEELRSQDDRDPSDEPSRLDRELTELLNELRVVLPGVQVMLAFLLTVPFTERFSRLTNEQETMYFVAFVASTLAVALLAAPSAHHRIQWRQHDKERLLRLANRLALAGICALALALVAVAYLTTDLLYSSWWGSVAGTVLAGVVAILWLGLPLWRRPAHDDRSLEAS